MVCLGLLAVTSLVLGATPAVFAGAETGIEGIWQGVLKVSGTELRVVFNISKAPDGKLTGTLDSPDQGATGIPMSVIAFEGGALHMEVKSIGGVFDGNMMDEIREIRGDWKQGGLSLPLMLEPVSQAPVVHRPQDPLKPYPYKEEDVSYENNKAGTKIAGTLTLPSSAGPFPAVLLVTGSGPQDRNETIFGHHPFLVLADHLTRRGIAVLRVDDRGVDKSTGDFSKATTTDFATDALAGVEYLRTRKDIVPEKVGLIGHSEGAAIASMVAAQTPDVAFIVLMAGAGVTGDKIILAQTALIAKASGASDTLVAKTAAMEESVLAVVMEEKDNAKAQKRIRKIIADGVKGLTEEEKVMIGYSEETTEAELNQTTSPWFREFLSYDPGSALVEVKCPVLAVTGEKDMQVPAKENLAAMEEDLKAGGNKNFEVRELPGLNHLFQNAETGSPAEYGKIEETMSPDALNTITDWILGTAK
jgi:hypothetical protein